MASEAIYFSQLTKEQMNGSESYRVRFSWGDFSIAPRRNKSGVYWYAYKRRHGRLFKAYVAKQGRVRLTKLQRACYSLALNSGLV